MFAKVKKVEHTGLTLSILNESRRGEEVWLPSEEWSDDDNGWRNDWESMQPETELDVVEVPQFRGPGGKVVVSRRKFGPGSVDGTWLHQPRMMSIESISRTIVRGRIGSISAVMKLQSYNEFLDTKKLDFRMTDHAALATGDFIGGLVTSICNKEGSVELDPSQYLDLREQEINHALEQRYHHVLEKATEEEDDVLIVSKDVAKKISPLLLIENDVGCRTSIETLLTTGGVNVKAVGSVQAASEHIANTARAKNGNSGEIQVCTFRMMIVDPNLDVGDSDLAGMQIVETMQSNPGCRILLMSGEVTNSHKLSRWGNLRVNGFLSKPFTTEQFLQALDVALALDQKELRLLIEDEDRNAKGDAQAKREAPSTGDANWGYSSETVEAALRELVSKKAGITVHVFELHPRSFRARSLAHVGDSLKWESLKGKIGKSRIKDAAIASAPIFETVSSLEGAHFWTGQMMSYQSFCGIPLDVGNGEHHALVAFHPAKIAFEGAFRLDLLLCAEKVARIIECQRLIEGRSAEATFAATGMAFESLAHEHSTNLSTIDVELNNLQNEILEAGPGSTQRIHRYVSSLKKEISGAIETNDALRGARARKLAVSIQYCLRRASIAAKQISKEVMKHPERLVIEDVLPEESGRDFKVSATPATLIIVLFNLYLNAMQQIDLMLRIRKSGRIWHSLEYRRDRKNKLWAYIRIHDTGPGIHPDDWNRVFDAGYTTKPGGTGLGLYICRHLLSSISEGGRQAEIFVTASTLWDGTTFAVKLPVLDQ